MTLDTRIEPQQLNDVVSEYGLGSIVRVHHTAACATHTRYLVESSSTRVVVRIDDLSGELDLKREIDLMLYLRRQGYPCPEPLRDLRGRHYRMVGGRGISVFHYIEGVQHEATSLALAQVEQAGHVLAELHGSGRGYKKGIDNRLGFERLSAIYRQLRPSVPSHLRRLVRVFDEEVQFLREYLDTRLPKGIIHGDLTSAHLVFDGERVIGVLDFVAAARGKFIADLASAVNALCFTRTAGYDIARFDALMAGYVQVRPLSLAEWDALPNELRFSALRGAVLRLRAQMASAAERGGVDKEFAEFYDRLRVLRREREGGMEHLLMAMATGYDYRKYQRGKSDANK